MSGGRSSVVVADSKRVLLRAAAGVTGVIGLYFKLVKSQSPVSKRSLVMWLPVSLLRNKDTF